MTLIIVSSLRAQRGNLQLFSSFRLLVALIEPVGPGREPRFHSIQPTVPPLRHEASHPSDLNQAGLTAREDQILKLIAQGLSNKMIARKLDITEGTVKVHVKHLLKKLNLRSRVEVAVWAVNNDPSLRKK